MAEFLDSTGISSALTDLIKESANELYLISPYIRLTSINKKYIQNSDGKNFDITIIHRADAALKDDDQTFLQNLNNVKIYSCDDLHAKCYLNENFGVISTMNMYEHSQTSNWEMGVKFTRKDDPLLFKKTRDEILRIVEESKKQPGKKIAQKTESHKPKPEWNKNQQRISPNLKKPLKKGLFDKIVDSVLGESGYCIRCREMIEYNPEKPYCDNHYSSWAKYKNPNYRENYCHICGEKAATTKVKPTCIECYNKHFRK